MKKGLMIICILTLIIPGLIACQKKVTAQPTATPVVLSKPVIPSVPVGSTVGVPDLMNQKIFFDFDKSLLDKKSQDILSKKAEWLKATPSAKLQIEGHCDERGTAEYNLALGERRAQAAKLYLTNLGIDAKRIGTISYGEERPTCKESVEACWSKNRNDTFITIK
jgi:peptidoglycan-associated lipoprotein